MTAITPASILAEVATLAEAKEIARDMRATALAVESKYGLGHPTSAMFSDRYFAFVDEMAERFAA